MSAVEAVFPSTASVASWVFDTTDTETPPQAAFDIPLMSMRPEASEGTATLTTTPPTLLAVPPTEPVPLFDPVEMTGFEPALPPAVMETGLPDSKKPGDQVTLTVPPGSTTGLLTETRRLFAYLVPSTPLQVPAVVAAGTAADAVMGVESTTNAATPSATNDCLSIFG